MAVNVLGGSLEFDAILTTGDLQSGIAAVEGQIQKTIDSFANLAEQSGQSLDEMKAKLAELEKQEETLRVAIDQATDPEMIKQYNVALAETVSQMKELQQAIKQGGTGVGPAALQPVQSAATADPDIEKEKGDVKDLEDEYNKLHDIFISLIQAQDKAFGTDEFQQYGAQIDATSARLKQLMAQIDAIQDTGPISDSEKLKQLEEELQSLEKLAARFKSSLSNAINPELIAQYNKGLEDTQAKMRAIYGQLAAIEEKEQEALKTPPDPASIIPPVPPDTSPTPTEPGGEDEEVQVVEKKIMAYQRLQLLKNQLASMDKNDPAFKATYDEAVKLQGQINNVNRSLQLTSRNVVGIEALAQGARALIGAFQAYNGVLGLTTEDQEQLQKSVTQVVSAMGVLNGIQEIAAVLDKNSSLNIFLNQQFRKQAAVATTEQAAATEVLAVAQEGEAVATAEAAASQEALNVAMESNPVGIILLALTAIVVALQAYSSSQKDVTEQQTKANEAAAEAADTLAKLVDQYRQVKDAQARAAANAVSLAQAQGQSEQAVLTLKLKQLEAEKTANEFALAQLGYSSANYADLQATLEIRLEELQALQSVAQNGGELSKQSQERLTLLQAQIKALEAQINPTKALIQANDTLNAQIAANNAERDKKAYDASLKSAEAVADAKLLVDRKYTAQALADEIDAIKARAQVELNNPNLTTGEQFKIQQKQQKDIDDATREFHTSQLKSEQDFADARLLIDKKNSQQALEDQIAGIRARTQVQLQNPDLLDGERANILAQQKKDIDDANREYQISQIDATRNVLEARLALVQEGSSEELSLRLQVIQKTSESEIVAAQGDAAKILKIKADRAKAELDLAKQTVFQNSESDIETTISGINTQLAVVQKGSEQELDLRKHLVDQQAALDAVQAQERIKSEDLLAAKILEINAEASVKKKKLDDDYIDHIIDNQLKVIKAQGDLAKVPQNAIINDPFATASDKYQAVRENLVIDRDVIEDQINAISNAILKGNGDINKLIADRRALMAKLNGVDASIDNTDKGEDKRKLTDLAATLGSIGDALNTMGTSLEEVNPGLATFIKNMGQVASLASKAVSIVTKFASGDYIGAIVQAVSTAVTFVAGLFGDGGKSARAAAAQMAEFQNQVLVGEIDVNEQYRERLRMAQDINSTKIQGIKDEQALLKQQQQDSSNDFNTILAQIQQQQYVASQKTQKSGGFFGLGAKTSVVDVMGSLAGMSFDQLNELFNQGRLDDKAKELFQELQKLQQEGVDIDQQLQDLQDQANQLLTGTTSDAISSSIIDGFKQGYRSAADFADNFQDLMTNALLSSLQSRTLEPALDQFYNEFAADADSDNVLTSAEISQLQNQYNAIINNAASQFQQLQLIAGTNLASSGSGANSLSAAIKGITEDQAELLAGQFGGLRITAIDQLKVAQQNLDALNVIVDNTGNLLEMRAILRRLELNGIKIQ